MNLRKFHFKNFLIFYQKSVWHITYLRWRSAENLRQALMYSFTWLYTFGTNSENGNCFGNGAWRGSNKNHQTWYNCSDILKARTVYNNFSCKKQALWPMKRSIALFVVQVTQFNPHQTDLLKFLSHRYKHLFVKVSYWNMHAIGEFIK